MKKNLWQEFHHTLSVATLQLHSSEGKDLISMKGDDYISLKK